LSRPTQAPGLAVVKSLFVLTALAPSLAHAQDGPLQTPLDTVWVAVAAALVFFMQAGFALLEGGTARTKNAVNVIMKNVADLCFGALTFWAVGFGLMFGKNLSGWLGTSQFLVADIAPRDAIFLLFQMMFAATAATIVSGAVAERMRFAPYVIASMIITALIYPVFGSWAWGSWFEGKGWLAQIGFIDFAGSTVVHSVGAWCSLAGIIVVGSRQGRFAASGVARSIPGHNLPLIAQGGFILWLGWFGFNGGSTLSAHGPIGLVLLNTNLAAAAGFVGVAATLAVLRMPFLMSFAINGIVGGLVAITAGCATQTPPYAVLTGLLAGVLVVSGTLLMERLRLDDVVGAVPVHGFCGAWGTLAAGIFYRDQPFDLDQIGIQLIGIGAAFLWTFPTALATFWVLKRTLGLRAQTLHEQRGLDITEHYEIGYPEFQHDVAQRGRD